MQYHKASFIGLERSKKAQLKLFDYTGYAMLTYTVKQDGNGFSPVGAVSYTHLTLPTIYSV